MLLITCVLASAVFNLSLSSSIGKVLTASKNASSRDKTFFCLLAVALAFGAAFFAEPTLEVADFLTGAALDVAGLTGAALEVADFLTGAALDVTGLTGAALDVAGFLTGAALDVAGFLTGAALDVAGFLTGATLDVDVAGFLTGAALDVDVAGFLTGAALEAAGAGAGLEAAGAGLFAGLFAGLALITGDFEVVSNKGCKVLISLLTCPTASDNLFKVSSKTTRRSPKFSLGNVAFALD